MDYTNYLHMIQKEVFNTLGCTDPTSIGLAASIAYNEIKGKIKNIHIELDNNLYKNAHSVGIPGTNKRGVEYGIAFAIVAGNPDKKLLLFEDLKPQDVYEATDLVNRKIIEIVPDNKYNGIYIYAKVLTDIGKAEVKIKGAHDNVVEIKVNDEVRYKTEDDYSLSGEPSKKEDLISLDISECINIAESLPIENLIFLKKGIDKNIKAAEYQLSNSNCQDEDTISFTKSYNSLINSQLKKKSMITQAKKYVIAASEARMSGKKVEIVGCFGSGNHGITFFITMGIVAKYLNVSEKKLLKAMFFALLIAFMIKQRTGVITPHCGCAVAISPALAAAIVYLQNGDKTMIESAFNIVLSNIMGILCDGANLGCALKTGLSCEVAIESAFASLHGYKISSFDGLVGRNIIETLDNIELLAQSGKKILEKSMVDILKRKHGDYK